MPRGACGLAFQLRANKTQVVWFRACSCLYACDGMLLKSWEIQVEELKIATLKALKLTSGLNRIVIT